MLAKSKKYKSFKPYYQDLGGLTLIRGTGVKYDKRYSRSAFKTILRKMGGQWASLPGSPYGQPIKPFKKVWKQYTKYIK
jgi:muramidase (phage lysozyme)